MQTGNIRIDRGGRSALAFIRCRAVVALTFLLALCGLGRVTGAEISAQAWVQEQDGQLRLAARLTIPEGYYLYHTQMGDSKAIGIPLGGAVRRAVIQGLATSVPHAKPQKLFDGSGRTVNVNVHTGKLDIYLLLNRTQPGPMTLLLRGQMCNDAQCVNVKFDLVAQPAAGNPEAGALFAAFPPASEFTPVPPAWEMMSKSLTAVPAAERDGASAVEDGAATATSGAEGRKPGRGGLRGGSVLDAIPAQAGTPPADRKEPPLGEGGSAGNAGFAGSEQPPARLSPVAASTGAWQFPEFAIRTVLPERTLVLWLAIAFLAGFLLNFMPCVLPVISLKIIGFINQSGEDRRRLLGLSLAFTSGMVLVFLALAGLAIGAGLHWGEQFQTESFNIALVVLVFAFALSFFGVYEFGVPDTANRLQAGGLPREGYLGAFCTGMLATVLATPCSGPFLGATLTWALAQSPAIVLLVFLFLGLGMALPYVLLSLSQSLRKLLPKPGGWMLTFRQLMGFALLLTVVYLLIFVEQKNLVPTVALLVPTAFACWLGGKYSGAWRPFARRWLVRLAGALVIAGAALLFFGPLKPLLGGFATARNEGVRWLPFEETSFRADLAAGKNVLLDFTADWCANCKYNEYMVFGSQAVTQALSKKMVVAYQIDLTGDGPATARGRELLSRLGGSAIPYAAFFPAGEPLRPYVLPDVLTRARVLEAIEQLPLTKP